MRVALARKESRHAPGAGAENILALRGVHSSRRLDAFWKERLNGQAARNDCLALAA
jgi:hypothetical protein